MMTNKVQCNLINPLHMGSEQRRIMEKPGLLKIFVYIYLGIILLCIMFN